MLTSEQEARRALADTERKLAKAVRLSQEAMRLMTDEQLEQLRGVLRDE